MPTFQKNPPYLTLTLVYSVYSILINNDYGVGEAGKGNYINYIANVLINPFLELTYV